MKIPKIISYCWFGNNPLPEKVEKCIDSWKKMCPDYTIIRWDESNYDVEKNPYIRDAYKEKKWAFVSDYARLDIIYEHGGIYLDTDVELISSLDLFLKEDSFFAIERNGLVIATGLGFGALPGNTFIKDLLNIYNNTSFYKEDGNLNLKACTMYTTEYFERYGYKREDVFQRVGSAAIYPSEYFCPMDFFDGTMHITNNTVGIHWYDMSWFDDSDKKIHKIETNIRRYLPSGLAVIVCKGYRNGYRLIEYSKKGILFEKIIKKISGR